MTQPVNLSPVPKMYDWKWTDNMRVAVNAVGSAKATEIVAPTTGFTHQIPNATGTCLLTPASGLAAGTVTLPVQALEGFEQHIVSTQTVTTLTVSPSSGQTISGPASLTLAAYSEIVYRFVAASSTWYKVR